jgi:septal ring factor EnvC (AmiA/AmiB activator)
MHRSLAFLPLGAFLVASLAAAQPAPAGSEGKALLEARRQADEATRRSELLERRAEKSIGEAARARADAAAVAARIEAAEAQITAAETRIRIIEGIRAVQRARLAEKQGPVVRLAAALQTMARRPPALALVQPGSLDDVVHVRSLMASTLPIIRGRTAALRLEIERGNEWRRRADQAYAALVASRQELSRQRTALARLEARERRRSQNLMESALSESDRALAFGEEARDLTVLAGTRQFQARLERSLSALPGPLLRPGGARQAPPPRRNATYILPVEGRLLSGMGEISDAGIHARGLTFAPASGAEVVAPAKGRVVYAGRFRGYGEIVIIDHGQGWTSAITNLGVRSVKAGDIVAMGATLGRAATADPRVTLELRRHGRPFPIAPMLALG